MLTSERIDEVVKAHKLTHEEGDGATKLAMDVINMVLERHLSKRATACAMEILSHLRDDRCVQP
jgi:hypothetical protein